MRDIKEFDKNDWNHLNDVILEATWNTTKLNLSQPKMEELFEQLPDNIKSDAYHWGLNDTVVRDNIYEWFQENK